MTQKELAYVEDAIGHEGNIIKICEQILKNLKEESLISFIQNEINKHQTLKQKLMNILEVKSNE